MPRKKLVLYRDVDDDGNTTETIAAEGKSWYGEPVIPSPEFTLEELADSCDHLAENKNAHEFAGSHRVLAALLYRELGRKKATELMQIIGEYDGLNGMSGVCQRSTAYEDFNLTEYDLEWSLGE